MITIENKTTKKQTNKKQVLNDFLLAFSNLLSSLKFTSAATVCPFINDEMDQEKLSD